MTRRRPPLTERRLAGESAPSHVPSHLVAVPSPTATGSRSQDPALALRVGGDGVVLGVEPHGGPLGVRLFRAAATRVVLVGSPHCAQVVAYRAVATGARIVVSTARPQIWSPLANAGPTEVRPVDATAERGRRTHPLLYIDDAPPYGRPPELPTARWTTVLTVREALTHRDAELLERADLMLLQPLTPAEADVLASARKNPGITTGLPPDVLTVVHRGGHSWGRLSVTPIEHHYFGPALRR